MLAETFVRLLLASQTRFGFDEAAADFFESKAMARFNKNVFN